MNRILRSVLVFLLTFLICFVPVAVVFALHAFPLEDVSAVGIDSSVGNTFQRNTFYGAGRAWVFYMGYDESNDSHIYFRSCTNGVNWQPRTLFCDVSNADEFSLHWDGLYVYTTWVANDGLQSGVSYRRGTPNSNGTITWVATQEVRIPGVAQFYKLPTITAMDNRPYLAYGHTVGGIEVWAAESSNVTTGAWSSDLLFENLDLMAGNVTTFACIDAVPSSNLIHVAMSVCIDPAVVTELGSLKYTEGGGWSGYELIDDTGLANNLLFSTVVWTDYVNVVYVQSFPGWLTMHRQSAPGGIWAVAPPPIQICDGSYQIASVSLWDSAIGDLKCFFADGAPGNIAWKFYDQALATWDVGFTELVVATCDRLETSVNHDSPLGVVYEDFLAPDIDTVYYDYLDAFPSSPTAFDMSSFDWLIAIILIVFVLGGILAILEWSRKGLSSGELATIVIVVVVGVIVCMAIWLSS